jgi:fructose-bisphosphate aldolase class 1
VRPTERRTFMNLEHENVYLDHAGVDTHVALACVSVKGMGDLLERSRGYYEQGARFAKW